MIKLELNNINTCKLHDELIAKNIIPILVESFKDTTWITIEEEQRELVMEVVKIHNKINVVQPKTELEILREKVTLQDGAITELAEIISILGGV